MVEHYLLILIILSYFHSLVDFQRILFQVEAVVPTNHPNSVEGLEVLDCLFQMVHFLALVEVLDQVHLLEVAQVAGVHQAVVGQNSMVAYSTKMIQSHPRMKEKLRQYSYSNCHYCLLLEEVVVVRRRIHSS